MTCKHFKMSRVKLSLFVYKLRMLDLGLVHDCYELDRIFMQAEVEENEKISVQSVIQEFSDCFEDALKKVTVETKRFGKSSLACNLRRDLIAEFMQKVNIAKCSNCKVPPDSFHSHGNTKIFQVQKRVQLDLEEELDEEGLDRNRRKLKYITPLHMYEHFQAFWEKEREILDLVFGTKKTQKSDRKSDFRMFFTQVIPVPPTKFRPASVMNDQTFEHPQNSYLTSILQLSQRIIDSRSDESEEKMQIVSSCWIQLQEQVNYFYDSSRNTSMGQIPPAGIKQILEKKEGLFRKHMMGKRVNYAARSVISPDPNIATNEIGIPLVFASKLTYPEPVTAYNVSKLRQMVINGPEKFPGASHIQHEDGSLSSLENFTKEKRTALANQLLTPQISGDEVHVNKKVLRHLQDGDMLLLNRQPTLHKPSMMAHKCKVLKGEKTIRMHYANCNTYNADFDGDEMNVHFVQNELAKAEAYSIANTDNQYLVPTSGNPIRGLIQDHIVSGVLITCKDTFLEREEYQQVIYGTLPETIQSIELLEPAILFPQRLWTGKQVISTLLLNLTRGFPALNLDSKSKIPERMWGSHIEESKVKFRDGHLLTGVLDKNQFGASAYGLVHACYELYGAEIAGQLLTSLGLLFTKFLQFIGFSCRIDDLLVTKKGNANRIKLIELSSQIGRETVAKYAKVKTEDLERKPGLKEMEKILRSDELMKGLDQEMKGKMNEITSKIIDACLPDEQVKGFPANNMSLMTISGAKGSNVNFSQISGLLGQQELEGRRVPVMVSGKTLPSFLAYDSSARAGGYIVGRFLTGIQLQEFFFHCMAGREGLIDTAVKTSRSGYLQRCLVKHLEGLSVNYDQTVRDSDGSLLQFHYGEDSIDVTKQKYLFKFDFSLSNFDALLAKYNPAQVLSCIDTENALKAAKKSFKNPSKYDPVMSSFNPAVSLGCTSDKYYTELEAFIQKNGNRISKKKQPGCIEEKQFRALMWLRFMNSLVEPGEAVGLLAAQSVGEPSTQMTLNTFHFAGFGAKNVTLGIPRLREIIMTASRHIKTPAMIMKLKTTNPKDQQKLVSKLSKVSFNQVIECVKVTEKLQRTDIFERVYVVEIEFRKSVLEEHGYELVKDVTENMFVPSLISAISKQQKKSDGGIVVNSEKSQKSKAKEDEESKDSAKEDFDEEENSKKEDSDSSSEEESQKSETDEDNETDEETDGDESRAANDETDQQNGVDSKDSKKSKKSKSDALVVFNDSGCKITLRYPSSSKILLTTLIEETSLQVVIKQIPQIEKAFVTKIEDDNGLAIGTDGVNIQSMWEFNEIDHNKIYSNDIGQILETFGVEACRSVIKTEISNVFKVYGISVDPRHLSLIADYMTFEGSYKPFNRMGIENSSSPFHKMTFETTLGFLKNATLFGDYDELKSPSASIVMGQLVKSGTGSFSILQPIQ